MVEYQMMKSYLLAFAVIVALLGTSSVGHAFAMSNDRGLHTMSGLLCTEVTSDSPVFGSNCTAETCKDGPSIAMPVCAPLHCTISAIQHAPQSEIAPSLIAGGQSVQTPWWTLLQHNVPAHPIALSLPFDISTIVLRV